ncbi:cytoglobin-2 [Pseudomyrmex gracilis]|uniref:cytoglobin-2 n=1 Tax=Pseudomyrmex gracilis TaxID=219809 RepID=UPI0009953AE7|nr:cytoglobin-2 [Pseudomyrmex gracilis]XP_020288540.1 cytoglobin-2 [Pseudomyrmex gracilis]
MFRGLLDFITNDNKVDEKLGMTEKQKKIVQNTWATVRKDPVSSGIAIMHALFTEHPEYQNQFKAFKDMPFDELAKNKKFQAHCANIVSAISGAIDQLHDPTLMEATLLSLAERHKNRGQKLEHFQNLKQVMINLLPTVFGKQYTPEAQEAWKKILDLMFSTFGQVYND